MKSKTADEATKQAGAYAMTSATNAAAAFHKETVAVGSCGLTARPLLATEVKPPSLKLQELGSKE